MRIEDSVRNLYEAIVRKKEVDEYVAAVKKKTYLEINNYMFSALKKGVESFVVKLDDGEKFYMNPVTLRVTKQKRKHIVWDCEKLKRHISWEKFKKVTKRTYTISNMDGMIEYMKRCGVDPKQFRKFLTVETSVDEQKLNSCYELGEITEAEINGCYTVQIGEPYFSLRELKR